MFCFTSIHNGIFLLFRKITHIRGSVWFKLMPKSTGSGNYYHRGVHVSRYLIAVFSKSADYKIYSHICLIFAYFCSTFFLFFLSFFSSNFLFYLFFFAFLLSFISFTHTHSVYLYTHICALCTKLTKTQTRKNIRKYKLLFIST